MIVNECIILVKTSRQVIITYDRVEVNHSSQDLPSGNDNRVMVR